MTKKSKLNNIKRDKVLLAQFDEWIDDGNVIKLSNGYATQDAQYMNRLKTIDDLFDYFVKEFCR